MTRPWPWQNPPEKTADELLDDALAKKRRRDAYQRGQNAQELVGHHLRRLGYACLWRVHTGTKTRKGRRYFTKAVEGDWRAVRALDGCSVLCEVKARPDSLSLSDFEYHQLRALQEHHAANGIALVAWVRGTDVAIMRYPIPNFAKHRPLSWTEADAHNLLNPAF